MFFSWVSGLWPATIPIFYAFGPWLNVIEDPCLRPTFYSHHIRLSFPLYFFLIPHCTNSISSLHIFVHHCTFCASLHVKASPDIAYMYRPTCTIGSRPSGMEAKFLTRS